MQYNYNYARPPVLLPERRAEFTCLICGKMGYGPPNSRVHPGECQREHARRGAARRLESRKKKEVERALSECSA